jgi:hypothetical protein
MYLENKYTKWYYNLINRAKNRILVRGEYYETHHIIPKSLGGTDNKTNLVKLTAREHFVCHLLLIKMTTGKEKSKFVYTAAMMSGHQNKNGTSRIYQQLRKQNSFQRKEFIKEHGPNKGMLGKKHTKEWCEEHSKKMTGDKNPMYNCVRPMEWRKAHSMRMSGENNHQFGKRGPLSANYGKPSHNSGVNNITRYGEEQAAGISAKMSASAKNKPKIQCPHCSLIGTTGNMKRWHFDNCKEK